MIDRSSFASRSTGASSAVPSSAAVAYARLKRDVVTGQLPPGSALHEGDLAIALAVSKTPIREALGRLVRDGYVEVRPRKGYRVTDVTLADITELFAIRVMLEPAAVGAAAERASPAQLQQLQDQARQSFDVEDDAAFERSVAADRRFHLLIADASGNGRLVEATRSLMEELERIYFLGMRLRRAAAEETMDHQVLVDAMRLGDPSAARLVAEGRAQAGRVHMMAALLGEGLEQRAATPSGPELDPP